MRLFSLMIVSGGGEPWNSRKFTRPKVPIDDPVYRERLKARLLAGRLPPALECLLWHYAKGKPKDDLQVTGNERGPLEIIIRKPWASREGRSPRSASSGRDYAGGVPPGGRITDPSLSEGVAYGVWEGRLSRSDSARLPAACRVPDYAEFRAGRVPFGPLTINLALAKSA